MTRAEHPGDLVAVAVQVDVVSVPEARFLENSMTLSASRRIPAERGEPALRHDQYRTRRPGGHRQAIPLIAFSSSRDAPGRARRQIVFI